VHCHTNIKKKERKLQKRVTRRNREIPEEKAKQAERHREICAGNPRKKTVL